MALDTFIDQLYEDIDKGKPCTTYCIYSFQLSQFLSLNRYNIRDAIFLRIPKLMTNLNGKPTILDQVGFINDRVQLLNSIG